MAVTTEQVAELYVAFFDRAPDADGLAYWVETGLTIEEISSSFFDQEETQTKYPESMTDAVFVNEIYVNMFNHAGDPDGITYWENELVTGSITRANMILAIANGALDTDQTILDNKTEVGLYFADAGLNDVEQAAEIMSDVDETAGSVTIAQNKTDSYALYKLTAQRDIITASEKDDTITGDTTTYTSGDNIDGGEGNDTFEMTFGALLTDPVATLTNVENAILTNTTTAASINVVNWDSIENITLKSVAGNANTISGITKELGNVTVNGSEGNTVNVTFVDDTIIEGTENNFNLTIEKSSGVVELFTNVSTDETGLFEELTLESLSNTGDAGLTLDTESASALKKVSLTGDGEMAVILTDATKVEEFDASAFTGNLTYSSDSTKEEMIKGGSGDDELTVTGTLSEIYGGAGDDMLTGVTSTDIYGGLGADYLIGATGSIFKIASYDETGITTETADRFTDDTGADQHFETGTDKLAFIGLEAGSGANFINNTTTTTLTTVEAAVEEANKAELAGKTYVAYNGGTSNSYLVIDADGDGEADMAIDLGEDGDIALTDIVAY